ncbi:Lactoylglutathione lyase [Leifsonia rubra CMS 76R]|nr:Lactoylglutathione lyase [Leifsonia rubra CMS 76R]
MRTTQYYPVIQTDDVAGTVAFYLQNFDFEVKDVDAEHERALSGGLPIVKSLRDEPFGQRHFITRDPNGVLIDIITPTPPDPEFTAAYSPETARP